MQPYQEKFLDYVTRKKILKFGEFSLKSGRTSPYFFNTGLFNTGAMLSFLGQSYAAAIKAAAIDFDVLLGPAYKGIPLASATSIALWELFQQDVPYSFNRKEAKTHGDGGDIVGSPLENRVLIIDDVISAGDTSRETIELIARKEATPAGVVIAVDRQEKGHGELSAVQELEREFNIPVVSIISLEHIIESLECSSDAALTQHLPKIREYEKQYGV